MSAPNPDDRPTPSTKRLNMARTRPLLEGLIDINKILVSNMPHETQLLTLQALELINNQQTDDPFFRKYYAEDFEHVTWDYKPLYIPPSGGTYTGPFNQIMAARKKAGNAFRVNVVHADTYVDEKMTTADVCITANVVNTGSGLSGECIIVFRWLKVKDTWMAVKSLSMRYALGF